MSKVALSGNVLGTGTVTLASPNTNSTVTLNLPSTAGTVLIQDGTNTTTVVNLTATGTVNVGGGNISPQTGFKNRIINGAMTIDQRNAGAAVTPSVAGPTAQYIMDRFRLFYTAASKITIQQTTDAPPGFTYSAKLTVASSYNPTVADDQYFFGTSFEADNIGDFAFGTASAATATVSFWIKSSVTGTYSLSWVNSANNRSYVQTFTISSANTWEQKAITISGDTSGTWINTGNARHSFVQIMLGNGSNFDTSTVGSWQSANVRATSGSVEFVAQANGSTMFITGFQLEKGSTATPFEYRSIGTELALCQRYYEFSSLFQVFSGNVTSGEIYYNPVRFSVTKRAAPTVVAGATNGVTLFVVRFPTTALTTAQINSDGYYAQSTANATGTGYYQYSWTASAEL
jgi:hypothetical protein